MGIVDSGDWYGYGVMNLAWFDGSKVTGDLIGHSGHGGGLMYYNPTEEVVITGTNNNDAYSSDDWVLEHFPLILACASEQKQLAPPTPTEYTCGEIRTAYKSQSCCGQPANPFVAPPKAVGRRMISDP